MFKRKFKIGDRFIIHHSIGQIVDYDSRSKTYLIDFLFRGYKRAFYASYLSKFPKFTDEKAVYRLQHLKDLARMAEVAFQNAYLQTVEEVIKK